MQLDLFRIRVFPKTAHGSLFTQNLEPAEVLRRAVLERPRSHHTKRGVDWHVGNVEELKDGNVYFRLGKQSRATLSRIDNTGNFTEAELENAPYTHAVLDFGLELCALAKNTALSPSTIGIARRLQQVLNDSKTALENEVSFVVGRVNNPDGFLNLLSRAYSIRSFTFTFMRQNPFDEDKDFVKPFGALLEEAHGDVGQATIRGTQLRAAPLEQISRSAATTGDDVKARLQLDAESPFVVRKLSGNIASVSVASLHSPQEKVDAIQTVRKEYQRVRVRDDAAPE